MLPSETVWGKSHNSKAAAPSDSHGFPVGAPAASKHSAKAPSLSDLEQALDLDAAIETARTLGMPRLAAYLTRMKEQSLATTTGPERTAPAPEVQEEGPAPAPEPSKKHSGKKAAAPGPAGADHRDDAAPYFKGKPLARTEADKKLYEKMKADQEKAKADGKAAPLAFPIIYLDQLYNVNDLEADEIFAKGTAEIPSYIAESASSS